MRPSEGARRPWPATGDGTKWGKPVHVVQINLKPWGPRAPEGGTQRAKGEPQPCLVAEPGFGTVPMVCIQLKLGRAALRRPRMSFSSPRGAELEGEVLLGRSGRHTRPCLAL